MGDDVIQRLFDKIDGVAHDTATIKAQLEERENRKHEVRIQKLELWKAAQEGVSGFIQRWGPVVISGLIAIWVATKGG
ncbi:hypothetical protein [Sporomusa aerivorans]|uniref:hypothetical protein n=1 Tax=Sporomusa aerivorans TaxID=204936 RepID=UPI00352A0521